METDTHAAGNASWVGKYAKVLTCLGAIILAWCIASVAIGYDPAAWSYMPWRYKLASLVTLATVAVKGFLAIGMASFLTYALGTTRHRPGWVIRFTEKALYLLALLSILGSVLFFTHISHGIQQSSAKFSLGQLTATGLTGLVGFTGAMLWVALGLVLRRVLPMIEESRTLV